MKAIDAATKSLEEAKATLGVENRLDAGAAIPDPEGALTKAGFDPTDLADLLGVSRVQLEPVPQVAGAAPATCAPRILDLRAEPRCQRSWKRDSTVKKRSDGGILSDRDAAAVGAT
jgi:isoleucyl-tRNA synthetase